MSCSFIQMSSEEVKKMAEDVLRRIEERNKRVVKKWIAREKQSYEKSFFRRLFRMAVPTDEQLEEKFYEDWVRSADVSMYGWKSRDVATNLLRAASKSDTVSVSTEDLSFIS